MQHKQASDDLGAKMTGQNQASANSALIRSSTFLNTDGDGVVDPRNDKGNEHGGHDAGYKMLKTEI